jgi:murein DD-endopeptidase MepM/ murein hydrolase activator NlpD
MLFGNVVGKGKVIRPHGSPKKVGKFRVTQPFGCTGQEDQPRLGNCAHFHRGLDIADAQCFSEVFAPMAGKVKFAGKLGNGEKLVVINHGDGLGTSYGHLAGHEVKDGDAVVVGQRIGVIGATGLADDDACHLHFAVKSGLPARWGRLDFIPNPFGGRGDTRGRGEWRDPWPLLVQNFTIRPRTDVFPIRIRTEPKLGDSTVFATTEQDGTIHRASDGVSLGAVATPCNYGGQVPGEKYELDGVSGRTWEQIELDGAFRFIATPLAVLSAR